MTKKQKIANIIIIRIEYIISSEMRKGILYVLTEKHLYINKTNISKETSMVVLKKSMNVRTVQDTLIKMTVARE